MEGYDVIITILVMLSSFLLGAVGMLLIGKKTILNYLIVKVSRGSKVLLMGKTSFGWRSFVSKKDNNTLLWKYDKKPIVTTFNNENSLSRYMGVDMAFVDADEPARAISLKSGQLYPDNFDSQTFNNILIRALTRPNSDGDEQLKKMITVCIILGVLILLGILAIYFKVSDIAPQLAGSVL